MDNMDNQLTTTIMNDYIETTNIDFSDYDNESIEDTGMCDRSWVRDFRRQYEPLLFSIIVILGAVGNLLVVWIYTTMRNHLKTMSDIYLINLAVADLLFLCMLPFWAVDAVSGWNFGLSMCKIVSAVYKLNFFSSMLLLTLISVDRYIAILQVTLYQKLKKNIYLYSRLACLGVWFVSILLAIPELIFADVKTKSQQPVCVLVYSDNVNNSTKILVLSLQICMGFCLPLLVMLFCYYVIIRRVWRVRNFKKHKALRVVLAVVFVFVLSQLPNNGLLVMEALQAANTTITVCDTVKRFDIAGQIAKSVAYTHACLNPFLYAFIGVRFRRDLKAVLRMCGCWLSKRRHNMKVVPKRSTALSDSETTPTFSL